MRDEEYHAMFELEERLWWYQGMRAITASVLDSLAPGKAERALDVGCGTGYSLVWLRERFNVGEVYGVDSSPRATPFWRERKLDTVALASVDRLPFAGGQFDLVTCFDVIYQLNDQSASVAVSEIHRVLTPGGLLCIREPAYQWARGAHDVAVGTRRRYTRTDLRRLLRARGFEMKRATYANTVLFGAAVAYRILSRLTGGGKSDVKPVPGWLNELLGATLKLEARILKRTTLPFGLSVVVIAAKR